MYCRLMFTSGEDRTPVGADVTMLTSEVNVVIEALRQYAENKDNKDKLLAKSMVDDIERERKRWNI